MGHAPSREELRNTALSIALGLVLAVLFVTATSRAHLARASVAELPPELRVPVRMNPEPDVPGHSPPAFAEPNETRVRTTLASWQEQRIVARAREELDRVTTYDNSYLEISGYPMGDVARRERHARSRQDGWPLPRVAEARAQKFFAVRIAS